MPRITMIETKLMSRAVAWGLAILLAGAVPWPAHADYSGKYLEVCLQYSRPDSKKWVFIVSEAGNRNVYFGKKGIKTRDYSSGTRTEIDTETGFDVLYVRTINKLMDDDWNLGGLLAFTGNLRCQVMWKD